MYCQLKSRLSQAGCLGLALCAAACTTEEIQIDPTPVSSESGDIAELRHTDAQDNDVTCLTFVKVSHPEAEYEVRMNGRPLLSGLEEHEGVLLRGAKTVPYPLCVNAGAYDVSLLLKGSTVAHTGTISMHPGSQFVFVIKGEKSAPTIATSEIDMTPPSLDFSMRRLRITNLSVEKQSLRLLYYDQYDNALGSSDSVAYGETWSGTISAEIYGWRLAEEEWPIPIRPGFGSLGRWDSACRELPPSGLILLSAQSATPDDPMTWTHEFGIQRPTSCHPASCPDLGGCIQW